MGTLTLEGYMTADPTFKTVISNGRETCVCNFSIAVNDNTPTVKYWKLNAWGKIAEYIANHAKKGCKVYLLVTNVGSEVYEKDGRIRTNLTGTVVKFFNLGDFSLIG